jgi:hypothetical protein
MNDVASVYGMALATVAGRSWQCERKIANPITLLLKRLCNPA